MNRRKLMLLSAGVCLAMFGTFFSNVVIKSSANTTVPYIDDNGVKCVNINDLATAMKSRVDNNGASIDLYFEDNVLSIYPDDPFIYINGNLVALKTELSEDYYTKEKFNFPMPQKPTKNGNGYLIPVNIVEEKLGVKGGENGFEITEEVIEENVDKNEDATNKNPGAGNSGSSSSNNGGSSSNNGSSTNGGGSSSNSGNSSNNGSSSNSGGSSNNGGSSNGGSNNGGSQGGGNNQGGNQGGGNNQGGNQGGGNNQGGGSTQPVTGISPSELKSKLTSIGWERTSDPNIFHCNMNGVRMGMVAVSNKKVSISLIEDNSTFRRMVENTLQPILPNGYKKVINTVSSPFNNQTLKLDGKNVILTQEVYGVAIDVCWP